MADVQNKLENERSWQLRGSLLICSSLFGLCLYLASYEVENGMEALGASKVAGVHFSLRVLKLDWGSE